MNTSASTQTRATFFLLVFFAGLILLTYAVLKVAIAPDLSSLEGRLAGNSVDQISILISEQLRQVEAQQRSITQTVALLSSDDIDRLQPALVDQYGDENVFGGGIWPLPNKREVGRDKFSTFFAREPSSKQLKVNTHWNSPESLKYWEQAWYENGKTAGKGMCKWAKAYQDDASPQPRTNCAMPIYKGDDLYGVSTIDVTLGFFNHLVADMEEKIHGQILIVEADGKIVSNSTHIKENIVLKNVADIAGNSPIAAAIKNLLPQAKNGVQLESKYSESGSEEILFFKAIPGSPWFIATAIPMKQLSVNSSRIMAKLGAVQIPLLLLLLALILLGIRFFMRRLTELKSNIDALAEGDADLTRRLPETGAKEFSEVACSFNSFIARIQDVVRQVVRSSASMSDAIVEIAEGNEDLSERTVEQAYSLKQTSSSIGAITNIVQKNMNNATQANRLASDAFRIATKGGLVIDDVVRNMDSISQSSKKVVDIIGVINGIAFQTNILALNAAVEAARAGEQGRGFAVVASEVRNLAHRSADAAKDIKGLIEDSVTKIDNGSAMVLEAGQTMNEIIASNQNVTAIMDDIMMASHEQSAGIERVNQSIDELDEKTSQNGVLMNEVATTARAMREQGQLLQSVVGVFKV